MSEENLDLTVGIQAADTSGTEATSALANSLTEVESHLNKVAEAAQKSGSAQQDAGQKAVSITREVGAAQMEVTRALQQRFADNAKLLDDEHQLQDASKKTSQAIVQQHKEEAAAAALLRKETQEAAYVFMDFGYLLQAFGVSGGRAVGDAAYLMRDLGSTTGPIILQMGSLALAVGAVATAADVGFHFIKDAINDAANLESTMTSLGIAVKNQGGNWTQASGEIDRWSTALSRATIFSKQEAVTALNDLTQRGIGYADSQRIINVATDVASAKHQDLIKTVDQLSSAEGIRASGLVKYDTQLKGVIQTHGTLQQMLDLLAKQYSGDASAATQEFEGKQKLLKDTMAEVETEAGTVLLPTLSGLADILISLSEEVGKNSAAIGQWATGFVNNMLSVGQSIGDVWNVAAHVPLLSSPEQDRRAADSAGRLIDIPGNIASTIARATGISNIVPGMFDGGSVQTSAGRINPSMMGPQIGWFPGSNVGPSSGPFNSEEINASWRNAQNQRSRDQQAFEDERKRLTNQLDHDSRIGVTKSGGGSSSIPAEAADKIANQEEKKLAVQENLKKQLEQLKAGELSYEAAVAHATTSTAKQSAELALHAKVSADAAIAVKDITAANKELSSELTNITPALSEQKTKYESALSAQHAFVNSLHGGKAATKEQQEELHRLNAAVSQAWSAYSATHQAVATLNRELDANNAKLDSNRVKMNAFAEAQNAVTIKETDAIAKKIENENKRRELQLQALEDESATYNMSLGQQLRYYQQRLEVQAAADGGYSDEDKKLWDEIVKLEGEAFKQRADAHKNLTKSIETEETTMLDNILTKHKSFRDDLKTILTDIENNYKKTFENMILGALNKPGGINDALVSALSPGGGGGSVSSGAFTSLLSLGLPGGSASKPDGTTAHPVNVQVLDSAGNTVDFSLHGGSGGGVSSQASAIPSSMDSLWKSVWSSTASGDMKGPTSSDASNYGVLGLHLGSSKASSLISSLPTNAGALGFLVGTAGQSSASGAGQADMANGSFGSWDNSTELGPKSVPTTAQKIGSAITNFATGSALGSALNPGGNSTNAGIGDALGVAAGILTKANPLAGLGLAVGGDLIGSLFGPHETAAQTPDTSQPGYQQWLANFQGTAQNSNGKLTFAEGQYDTSIGNQSLEQQLTKYINNPSAWASAPAGVKAAIQQLLPYEGTTGAISLNTSNPESQGNFNLTSGKSIPVTQLQTLLNTIQAGMGSDSTSPVFNLSRAYPTFSSTLSGQVGSYTTNTNQNTDAYGNPVGSSSAGGGTRSTLPGPVNVTVNLNNTVGAIPDDVVNQLVPKIRDAVSGFTPGGYSAPLFMRNVGN